VALALPTAVRCRPGERLVLQFTQQDGDPPVAFVRRVEFDGKVELTGSAPFAVDRFWEKEPTELRVVSTLPQSSDPWLEVRFRRHLVRPHVYKVLFHPEIEWTVEWRLLGSLDGRNWMVIAEEGERPRRRGGAIICCQCVGADAWARFRLERTDGKGALAVLYFDIFGDCMRSVNVPGE
jgi:hypothetical protein